ncbi:hypothetical protein NDU88_005056, partial [Pleurodeles waltl]
TLFITGRPRSSSFENLPHRLAPQWKQMLLLLSDVSKGRGLGREPEVLLLTQRVPRALRHPGG